VIAGHMVEAVERGWGDQDSQERPTMRRGLRAVFTALAELGLTLCEATYFLLPDDRFNARAWALQKLKDERARAYFERLDMLAANPRMSQTFDVETVGILNRIEEFTSSAAIRRIFGQRKGIDLRAVMDEGHVVLVNLAGGTQIYEKEGDLLGRLFLRAILYHAKRRTNSQPCFVWMDEGHRFVSGDVPVLFEEVRKHSVGIAIGHQDLSQLGEPGDRVREAILAVPQTRLLFRLNSMAEATLLAPEVVRLNLEKPVNILVKPTVVGDHLVTLRNGAVSTSSGTTDTVGRGVTHSTAETDSVGENWSKAQMKGVTTTRGRSVAVTARDFDILEHVRRHRFLSSAHLVALDGGNESNILARLRKLFDHGHLVRPLAQLATMPVIGPRPMVYGHQFPGPHGSHAGGRGRHHRRQWYRIPPVWPRCRACRPKPTRICLDERPA
jgi:hypothetical protein